MKKRTGASMSQLQSSWVLGVLSFDDLAQSILS
jgi:hypothetical protein